MKRSVSMLALATIVLTITSPASARARGPLRVSKNSRIPAAGIRSRPRVSVRPLTVRFPKPPLTKPPLTKPPLTRPPVVETQLVETELVETAVVETEQTPSRVAVPVVRTRITKPPMSNQTVVRFRRFRR